MGHGDRPRVEADPLEHAAVHGVGLLLLRTLGLQALTAAATIILAHLLTPGDYGVFAIALAAQQVAKSVTEFGLPAAVIRRPEPTTAREEQAITGFALLAGGGVALVLSFAAFIVLPAAGADSEILEAVAIACLAVPLYAFRMIPMALIERRLRFRSLVVVEVTETVTFFTFALATAAAGFGVYSLVVALPVSAAVGAVAATLVQPWRIGLRLDLSAIRPLARFGGQVSAIFTVQFARDLGLLATITAVGSASIAGFYNLSQRILLVPTAVMASLQRVGLPVLALAETPEDQVRRAARAVAAATVAVGLPIAVTAGAARPLVAVVFGERWTPTADVIVAAAAGWMAMATAGAILSSLLLARGDAASPLLGTTVGGIVGIVVAAVTVGSLGATGAGLAGGAAFLANTVVLILRSPAGAGSCVIPLARGMVVAGVAVGAGLAAGGRGDDVVDLVTSAAAATAVWLVLSLAFTREELRLVARLVARNARQRRSTTV